MRRSLQVRLSQLLDSGPFPTRWAFLYRLGVVTAIFLSTGIAVLKTVPGFAEAFGHLPSLIQQAAMAVLAVDYGLRLLSAWLLSGRGRKGLDGLLRYGLGAYGIFDFLAVVPLAPGLAMTLPADWITLCGIAGFLKLARYSPALETLGAVLRREARPLQASVFIMTLLALFASTLMYFVERDGNAGFASVPQAMWYSVVTLTTLGYGDVVPATGLGKMLGTLTAILGIGMFALPASILASGFSEEIRRRDFLASWHMVARVPFFATLDAGQIAQIVALLKAQHAEPGDMLIQAGDDGDCMYFIVAGQVEVAVGGGARPKPVLLSQGDFFGEIAIVRHSPRTATVTARKRCQLLVLHRRDFRKVTDTNPALREAIERAARDRLAQSQAAGPEDGQKNTAATV